MAGVRDAERVNRLLRELEREIDAQNLRLVATRLVARDVSQWVEDDSGSLDLIVEDVLTGWHEHLRCRSETLDPDRLWNRYANRVEFAPPTSGNEFRSEFCPVGSGPMDTDDYFRSVWAAHVAGLRSAAAVTAAAA